MGLDLSKSSFLSIIAASSSSCASVLARRSSACRRAAPCFFSVVHTFVEGKADGWWAMLGSMTDAQQQAMYAKWHEMGYHNHSFLPTSPTGLINCLWETKPGTTPEQFQAFIDGPDGPGEGVFTKGFKRLGFEDCSCC